MAAQLTELNRSGQFFSVKCQIYPTGIKYALGGFKLVILALV